MISKTAFIVLSCDKYLDLWPMYLYFFDKNWPDCKLDRYFITNNQDINHASFKLIKIGEDLSWSDNLIKVLIQLKESYKYVFISLEDVPIIEKVNQKHFEKVLTLFFELDGNFIALNNNTRHSSKFNEYFGNIEKGSLYRPTCEFSLWKISVLEKILVSGENAWEFEKYGAVRSDAFDKFYVVYNTLFKNCHTVVKGKWVRQSYRKICSLGYEPNIEIRPMFKVKEEIAHQIYARLFGFIYKYLLSKTRLSRKVIYNIKGYNKLKKLYY